MRGTRGFWKCLPPHIHTPTQAEAHDSGTSSLPQSPSGRQGGGRETGCVRVFPS